MKLILSKDLAGSVDLAVADPEYVANKGEEFIEVLGVVSVCSDQDIGYITLVPGHGKKRTRAHSMCHKCHFGELYPLW